MHLLLVSSKLFNYQLDWLVPDRVIDVPVYQDVLAWGEHGQASQGDSLLRYSSKGLLVPQRHASSLCDVCMQCEKNVDSLLIAKPALQLFTLEIPSWLCLSSELEQAVDSLQRRSLTLCQT